LDATTTDLPLVAYHHGPPPSMPIVPAGRWREWMNETTGRSANRCLPLLAGNEFGWFLLNERALSVEWSGGPASGDLVVSYDSTPPPARATSIFGHGIVTWRLPYLFRTPPGWDLLVRGPTNWPKDGVVGLDAVVETDWALATFTMNWKLTRPGSVRFEDGEPFCMLVPQRRHDLESFQPAIRQVSHEPHVEEEWAAFERSRHELSVQKFLAEFAEDFKAARMAWEGDYFRGRTTGGRAAPEHITKRRLRPFGEPPEEMPEPPPPDPS
jgi:hypothetical protein